MTQVKQNYRNVNNIFDELFNTVPAWNRALNVPPVNIHENEEGYHIELQVPGLQKEDFKINVEKGLLTVFLRKEIGRGNKGITERTAESLRFHHFNAVFR